MYGKAKTNQTETESSDLAAGKSFFADKRTAAVPAAVIQINFRYLKALYKPSSSVPVVI